MRPPGADLRIGAAAIATAAALLLAVSVAGAAGNGSSDPSFAAGPALPVGSSPGSVAVGDYDGNGSADLALGNVGYHNNVRILLNDGAGRFHIAPGSPFKVGTYPSVLLRADFDGDGKPDLAVGGNDIRILRGDGTAHFGAAGSPIELADGPLSMDAADVSSDGRPDLVVLTWSEGTGYKLAILLNDGSGGFSVLHGPTIGRKAELVRVAVADFNRDGKQDLVLSSYNSTTLSVFLGDGAAGFRAAPAASVGSHTDEIDTGDFNVDGKADLALFTDSGLVILLGNGAGGFSRAPGSPVAGVRYGYGLATADLNGDGKPDLAFVDDSNSSSVTVLLGNGTGGFHPGRFSQFYAGWPGTVAVADFNGDGKPDLFPLSGGVIFGPAPRGGMILFQTPSAPQVRQGRSLPASADAVFSTRQPVSNLAADGNRAAVCSDRVFVWTAPARRSRSFGGQCDSELAIAGNRVAWIEYWFGNTHRSIDVVVANASGGKPRQVDGEDDIEEYNGEDVYGGWWGQLLGGGPVLAYNSWWVDCVIPPCDQECEDNGGGSGCDGSNPTLRIRGQQLSRIGPRRAVGVRSGPTAYPLRAVGGGRIALEPDGVVMITPKGRRVSAVPAQKDDPPRGIALSARHLALLRTFTLDLYRPATGARQRSIPLGPAAGLELVGVSSKLALLGGEDNLMLARLSDGKLVSFPLRSTAVAGFVGAKLTEAGLFYAYNVPRGKAKGRVVFERTAKLLARFPR